ncbi:MAG: aminoacyl-tRNA hydrolase [Dehalococcoidales bacterium]|nr:aminoacyl-tRNA hydrolase [Dehalococcoidales bacterium]
MKLIVGLGNPGREYEKNRHNLGFMCLNHFAQTHGIKLDKKQGQARVGTGKVAGFDVVLARPQTYMNLSGQAVNPLVKRFKIGLEDLVVIHDDLDLPPGKIRIRRGGGAGGHKGIASIVSGLGSPDFTRLRVGIGRPETTEDESDIIAYVLSDFTSAEKQVLAEVFPRVNDAVLCIIREGLTTAMNRYN